MASATSFLRGNSHPSHPSPIPLSVSSAPSSSSFSSCHSICSFSWPRSSHNLENKRKATACMRQDDSEVMNCLWKKRAIMIVGFSFLPFLKMGDKNLESLGAEVSEIMTDAENERLEGELSEVSSKGSLMSILGAIGVLTSGVLGALYALARKEKFASEATIESLRNEVKEKQTVIVSMGKKFEAELTKEKEVGNEKLRKADEEQQSLASQLKSANEIALGIKQELQKERKIIEQLNTYINGLEKDLTTVAEEKNTLEENLKDKDEDIGALQDRVNLLSLEIKEKDENFINLYSVLAMKESKLKRLASRYQESQNELGKLNSDKKDLKHELQSNEKELELKNAKIADFNAQIGALQLERDESKLKLESAQKEYTDLKTLFQKKEAENAELLNHQERTIHQLKEQLESTLSEANTNKAVIADLSLESDSSKKMLDVERKIVKDLKQELQVTRDSLENSRSEAVELTKQLEQSQELCLGLEAEVSKVRADFAEVRESLTKKAEEAKQSAELLAGELMSLREILKSKNEEIESVSQDLATVIQIRNSLQQELVEAYKKAESAVYDLQEEKKVTWTLNKDLKALESQCAKEKEAKISVEGDLGKARAMLDELNQNALILTKELELANSQLSNSEEEKETLYKSLADQKQSTIAVRENLEDAHSLVMRLGEERQNLEKRAKKLEDDLGLAKGEILRLRSQTSSSKRTVNDKQPEAVEVGATKSAAAPTKRRTSRSKKAVPQEDGS